MKSQTPQSASSLSIHSVMQDGHPSHKLGAPGQKNETPTLFPIYLQW